MKAVCIQAIRRKQVLEKNPSAMDNWSEDCEQAAGEPEEGPLLLDVNAKMHKAKIFGAVYAAMKCQEPVCLALSRR